MNFIKIIKTKKIIFKKIKKKNLIILDNQFTKFKFKNIKFHIYNPDEYYFIEFFKSLLIYLINVFKINFGLVYFKVFINKLDPKVAIGHDLNNNIFNFKEIYPNKISIVYQFAYIFQKDLKWYKKKFQSKKADYYLVFDNRSKKILSKIITSHYKINGSTKVNEILPLKKKNTSNNIVFISRLRFDKRFKKLWKKNYEYDKYLVDIISKYCKKYNIDLIIAFNSLREDKKKYFDYFNQENKFYRSITENFKIGKENSLSLALKSKLVISHNSTLGYELLHANHKTIFIDRHDTDYKYFKTNEGSMWYYGHNKSKILNLINRVYNEPDRIWRRNLFKANKQIKYFFKNKNIYYKNNLLKKLLKKIFKKYDGF